MGDLDDADIKSEGGKKILCGGSDCDMMLMSVFLKLLISQFPQATIFFSTNCNSKMNVLSAVGPAVFGYMVLRQGSVKKRKKEKSQMYVYLDILRVILWLQVNPDIRMLHILPAFRI